MTDKEFPESMLKDDNSELNWVILSLKPSNALNVL